MKINKNKLSLEDATKYIYLLDFTMLRKRMVLLQGWLESDTHICEKIYKNFLFLLRKYPNERLPPTAEIDEFWHNHILDTKQYFIDCEKIFGKYLHHYPYAGMDGKIDMKQLTRLFNKTQELYYKEFGEYL